MIIPYYLEYPIVEYPIVRHRHRRLAPPEELADRKVQLDLKLRLLAMDVETQVLTAEARTPP